MKGIIAFVGMSIGGAIGWWIGMKISGVGWAVILSAIGNGFGLYYIRKLAAHYLE
jgi:hypothetical protein